MNSKTLRRILKKVANGEITPKEVQDKVERAQRNLRKDIESEAGGHYYY